MPPDLASGARVRAVGDRRCHGGRLTYILGRIDARVASWTGHGPLVDTCGPVGGQSAAGATRTGLQSPARRPARPSGAVLDSVAVPPLVRGRPAERQKLVHPTVIPAPVPAVAGFDPRTSKLVEERPG